MFKRRPHFISILSNIGRFLILLVIPLIRGLLVSLRGGFQFWLASAWMDIAVVVLIAAMGFAEWFCMGYCIDSGCLLFWQGILFRRVRRIPLDKISWASIVRPWYLRPLRAVEFRADTPGGSQNESDFTMLLYKSDAEYIFTVLDRLLPSLKAPPFAPREYRPRGFYVIILSALTSNSLAGILLASAAISRIGDLMGKEFSERIYGTLEQLARLAAFGVPPAAAALAYLLLGGWALAFLANLLRNKNLFVVRRANSFFIRGGLFTQRYLGPFPSQLPGHPSISFHQGAADAVRLSPHGGVWKKQGGRFRPHPCGPQPGRPAHPTDARAGAGPLPPVDTAQFRGNHEVPAGRGVVLHPGPGGLLAAMPAGAGLGTGDTVHRLYRHGSGAVVFDGADTGL